MGRLVMVVAALVIWHSSQDLAGENSWRRVYLSDPLAATVARRALDEAARLLQEPRCQAILTDFHDPQGRPVGDQLARLGVDIHQYLQLVLFVDAAPTHPCGTSSAVTEPGSRVVRVCGNVILRQWRDNADVAIVFIHEVLHTLGLGENPPASADITFKVRKLCGRR